MSFEASTKHKHMTREMNSAAGPALRFTMPHAELSPTVGMTTHPSVGRFTNDNGAFLFAEESSKGQTGVQQSMATQSNHGLLYQESVQSDNGIVDLRAGPGVEGKVATLASFLWVLCNLTVGKYLHLNWRSSFPGLLALFA